MNQKKPIVISILLLGPIFLLLIAGIYGTYLNYMNNQKFKEKCINNSGHLLLHYDYICVSKEGRVIE